MEASRGSSCGLQCQADALRLAASNVDLFVRFPKGSGSADPCLRSMWQQQSFLLSEFLIGKDSRVAQRGQFT